LEEKYPQESETPSAQPQPALTKSPNLLQNKLRENGIAIGKYLLSALRWIVLALAVGTISGLIGGAFEKLLGLVGGIYKTAPYLIYLLPLGGLAITFLYRVCGLKQDPGTNAIFRHVHSEEPIPFRIAPLIFLSTLITQLFGGSAGREGAALQLGGSLGATAGRLCHLTEKEKTIAVLCGMSGVFSALFGTPLTATVFAIEVISVGRLYHAAFLPCILSSLTATGLSRYLIGNHPIAFPLGEIPALSVISVLQVAAIAIVGAIISILLCLTIRKTGHYFKKWVKNPYLRVLIGSGVLILLTVLLQTGRFTGSGLGYIEQVMEGGSIVWYDFLFKILFTAITIASGFKGGEIVPTLFVGAALGGLMGGLVGLPITFGAAVGMIALFCGVVNCPIASILLSVELFGAEGLLLFALAACISYLLSGYFSLYSEQTFTYSKIKAEFIDRKAR